MPHPLYQMGIIITPIHVQCCKPYTRLEVKWLEYLSCCKISVENIQNVKVDDGDGCTALLYTYMVKMVDFMSSRSLDSFPPALWFLGLMGAGWQVQLLLVLALPDLWPSQLSTISMVTVIEGGWMRQCRWFFVTHPIELQWLQVLHQFLTSSYRVSVA